MRLASITSGLLLALALALPASAQSSTSPGYTAKDQAQFAKLAVGLGTWKCVDTPPSKKPDIATTTREGNWFVTRETGDDPSTAYARWSHLLQAYFATVLDDGGGIGVYETTASDPNNATWKATNPFNLPANKRALPYTVSTSGNTSTSTGQYYDKNGKLATFKSVCTKS